MVTDEQLIDLIPQWRGRVRGVTALGGGLTNRNLRVELDDGSFVLRVAGKDTGLLGIDRAVEAACAQRAAQLGIGPEPLAFLPEHEVLVRRFISGCVLTAAEVRSPEILGRVVASLRRYHESAAGPGSFSPFVTVRQYGALARERGVELPVEFGLALEQLAALEKELGETETPCPCHNDLLSANLIDDGTVVRIIDWEYAGMGNRFFDLGNLAVNNEFGEEEETMLLRLYFGAARPADLRRLRLMRLASDMREAAWGYVQAAISSLNEDFHGYGLKHLHRFLKRAKGGK
jgi:thiamine kinase-like enzyme